jgi:NodT family efflux transporter outer membrane factor (OMF) lipoprotein
LAAGVPSTLLERRPDIAAAERRVAAANATIGVTKASFYPTISMNLIYGLEASSFNIFSLPNDFWAVGPGLMLPIFEGGLRDAEEKAAVEALRLAAADYKQTVLNAFQETEDRLSELRLLGHEEQERHAQNEAAQQSLTIATHLYTDGATNFLDVVVAQNEAPHAEQALVQVRTQLMQASIGLVRALGGGWSKASLPDKKAIAL